MARLLCLAALLAACSEPDFWAFSSNQTGAGGGKPGVTVVAVWTSDSPVDAAESVFVVIDAVELDDVVLDATRREVDYVTLRNGARLQLARAELPPGGHDVLRLRLAASGHRAVVGGASHPLRLEARVIEIPGPFLLRAGESLELHLDLNLRLSVFEAGGSWWLRPALRLVDARDGAFVDGRVVEPGGAPVAGATVSAQEAGLEVGSTRTEADGTFRIGPLPAATTYTLVATAPGRAAAVLHGTPAGSDGNLLQLPAEATGSVHGSAAPGAGLSARLKSGDLLLALAGVDPATGAFAFDDVPDGVYDVEIWGPDGLRQVVSGLAAE